MNGDSYAGGLLLALAHDFRIMNRDFGNLSMSEIKNGFWIPPGASQLVKSRVPQKFYKTIVVTGAAFKPREALAAGMVDELHALEKLEERAMDLARKYASSVRDGG